MQPGIGSLERSDVTFYSSDLEIADNLNKFFESTFTHKDLNNILEPAFRYENVSVNGQWCQHLWVCCTNRSYMYWGFWPRWPWFTLLSYILKSYAHSLCAPLTILFCQSLNGGILPMQWVEASPCYSCVKERL